MKSFNKLFIVWIVVVILIFGGLITIGFLYKSKIRKYQDYEDVLIKKTETYISDKNLYPKDNDSIKVDVNELIDNGYLTKKEIIKDCTGNITVTKKKNITYKPSIKCKNYRSTK